MERLLADTELRTSIAQEARALVERSRDRNGELARVEASYRDLVSA
jgi:hypothetical protein